VNAACCHDKHYSNRLQAIRQWKRGRVCADVLELISSKQAQSTGQHLFVCSQTVDEWPDARLVERHGLCAMRKGVPNSANLSNVVEGSLINEAKGVRHGRLSRQAT
jgi:hypothetical protein